jgi:hypothetical protein
MCAAAEALGYGLFDYRIDDTLKAAPKNGSLVWGKIE